MSTEGKPVIAKVKDQDRWIFHCPGCGYGHFFQTGPQEPKWTWNGDEVRPTVSPSIRVLGVKQCHFYIRAGQIEYLSDCNHSLAGRTIAMQPFENHEPKP